MSGAVAANASNDSMFGVLLTIADRLGSTTSIINDTYGNATSVTDPLGRCRFSGDFAREALQQLAGQWLFPLRGAEKR
jgi:hypothetical protein